jgi:hypothetical protein
VVGKWNGSEFEETQAEVSSVRLQKVYVRRWAAARPEIITSFLSASKVAGGVYCEEGVSPGR